MGEILNVIDFKLFAIVLFILGIRTSGVLKDKYRQKKIKKLIDSEDEITIDLSFNNKTAKNQVILDKLATAFVSLFVSAVILIFYWFVQQEEYFNLPQLTFKATMILTGILAFVLFSYLYHKRKKIFKRLELYRKRYRNHDLVFNKHTLKINPFIIGDHDYNPDLRQSILEVEKDIKELDFVILQWKEIEKIEIDERDAGVFTIYYYLIKTEQDEIYLNRLNFKRRDEKEFLELVQKFSGAPIENNSKYKVVPLKAPKMSAVNMLIALGGGIFILLIAYNLVRFVTLHLFK
jgi:hypothetical protein